MQSKNLSKPDELRTFDQGKLELATLGGVTFGRATLQPGWKWSTSVKPLVKSLYGYQRKSGQSKRFTVVRSITRRAPET